MRDWRKDSWRLVSGVLLFVLVALGTGLAGCSVLDTRLGRAVSEAIGLDPYSLDEGGRRELGRFDAVYRTYARAEAGSGPFEHFTDAFKRVRADYVRLVDDAQLIDAAIKGVRDRQPEPNSVPPGELVETALDAMLVSLDPHSVYLNPDELHETMVSTSGQFGGLGIEITEVSGRIKVVSPIEGTPAYRAGIKPGDVITHLDGESIKDLNLMQSVMRMRGRPGTDIALTVERAGHPPFDVTITRAIIKIESVRWRIEGDIGYLRVATFSRATGDGVAKAMGDIHRRLGGRMKGLVIDLRNNPGGLLDQSVALADAFLERGTVVSVRGRDAAASHRYEANPGDLAEGLPMVVLINDGSASAAEIVAVALQDLGRATVMGVRSFGKGTVQTIMPLPGEGGLRMTTALYYSPLGRAIQARGVVPDIAIDTATGEKPTRRREADLPGALPASKGAPGGARARLDAAHFPAAGDNDDRQLGCALVLLRAGSVRAFLASLGKSL
jgi:carboxyl-terminal processing protease